MNRQILSVLTVASCIALFEGSQSYSGAAEPDLDREHRQAFAATTVAEVLSVLFPNKPAQVSSDVRLEVPFIVAPDGIVSVKVWARIGDVKSIAIVTRDNTRPLNTLLILQKANAYFATRIRLERTSPVTAYVETSRGLFSASSVVKVLSNASGMYPVEPVRRKSADQPGPEVTMMRARRTGRDSNIQVLVRHPMLGKPEQLSGKNERIGTHYIESLVFRLNGNVVAQALLSSNVAANPLTAIGVKGAATGDQIDAAWLDNRGHHGRAEVSID